MLSLFIYQMTVFHKKLFLTNYLGVFRYNERKSFIFLLFIPCVLFLVRCSLHESAIVMHLHPNIDLPLILCPPLPRVVSGQPLLRQSSSLMSHSRVRYSKLVQCWSLELQITFQPGDSNFLKSFSFSSIALACTSYYFIVSNSSFFAMLVTL